MTTTPPDGPFEVQRVDANEETTVLAPMTDDAIARDRTPVSRQKFWIAVSAVSAVAAILLSIAIGLMLQTRSASVKWKQQVEDVKTQNYDLGKRLGDEQTQVVNLQGENDQIASQLKTAQQKVLDLADEKAQQGDNVEFYARQIDELTTALSTAKGVSNALDRCIEGNTQLIGYLHDPTNYDPVEIADFEASLKIKCDNAVAANVELQQILAP